MSISTQRLQELRSAKVVLILGGESKEREISLRTGQAIFEALQGQGIQVTKFDPQNQSWNEFEAARYDLAFIALHGTRGEDGCVQGLLENLKIPYTGSGVMSSAICFDKIQTKLALSRSSVLSPEFCIYDRGSSARVSEFASSLAFNLPVVVKPNREGSSFGTTIVRETSQLIPAIEEALRFGQRVLIERFIQGHEITVGVLNGKALSSVEIVPRDGFYDYQNKYTAGKTDYYAPARLPESVNEELKKTSERIVAELGCRGAPRVDFMVTDAGQCYFLEVNTIPGMTATSLLPKAAKVCGIEFSDLCLEILAVARLDY